MDDLLKLLVDQCKKFNGVEKISLFGSRARGDFTERSDYDVAIYGDVALNDRLNIREICDEKLPTLHKIDVVFIDGQNDEAFLNKIHSEEVTIYDKV